MGWLKKLFHVKDEIRPVSVDDDNFDDEVLQSDLPVLLDVWSPSCVHCDRLVPVIMGLAQRYDSQLKVAEINGADSPRTMASLRIRGTPTIVYFHDGREFERVVGFRGSLYHQDLIENELLPAVEEKRHSLTEGPATVPVA